MRGYSFFRVESLPVALGVSRRDSEFLSSRFTLDLEFAPQLEVESHFVLDLLSPPGAQAASIATARGSFFAPLQHELVHNENLQLVGSLDRLNVQLNLGSCRIVAGRQAIGWGVNYFWPAMDLFSSFAPERIDREYKQGVDAVRVTVPLGSYSELQVIGAVLGPSLERDGAFAAHARLHLGFLDLGLMSGKFHGDTVAGLFVTTGIRGSAYRAEVTWTDSDDPVDGQLNRQSFWRVGMGVDRQLHPDIGVTLELSYNGYGASEAAEYSALAATDRFRRGEVNALGKYYTGASLAWQVHPLWILSQTLLVNWNDPSSLWIPAVEWSTSDNTSLLLALETGFGRSLEPDLTVRSEYGSVPTLLLAALKWYF